MKKIIQNISESLTSFVISATVLFFWGRFVLLMDAKDSRSMAFWVCGLASAIKYYALVYDKMERDLGRR